VLVTRMTSPDMVPAMERARAIITDEGGITSHAAIVSRELSVPCIVGTSNATKVLKDGQLVTVDAVHGEVFSGRVEIKEEHEKYKDVKTRTKIKAILDLPEIAEKISKERPDGVGLVRLEIMIAKGGVHPKQYIREGRQEDYIGLLMNGIRKIAEVFKGKPVWIRTSDIRTDEYKNLRGAEEEPKEANPMLGWHGIRRALEDKEILKCEFEAIKRLHEEGYSNIGIMLPFVIRAREVRKAKEIAKEINFNLEDIDFGVMIETPAACWIIEELAREGIKFVSFGTNDLTQLTLGIDRNNERIAKLYDEMHPSVLREITHVIKVCKKHGIETSICGQAGSRPDMASFLVKQGINSISVNPDSISKIREVVYKIEKEIIEKEAHD